MNAGRDVERLITGWLADEAADRAPDRVLEAARRAIDRTNQRRFLAAWREPVNLSKTGVAALAAVLVVALVGAAWIGRITAPGAGGPAASSTPFATEPPGATSSPSATGSAAAVTLESYKLAHDEICSRYRAQLDPVKANFEGLFDESTPEEERTFKAGVLRGYASGSEAMVAELAELVPPAEIAAEHAEMLVNYGEVNSLIRDVLAKLGRGDLTGAAASDAATTAPGGAIAGFETKHLLTRCP